MTPLILSSAALGMALMGGVYFTFSAFVMRALASLEAAAGVAAMQAINTVILKSLFMPLFFGTSLFAAAAIAWACLSWQAPGSGSLLAAGIVYLFGMFLCIAAGNVPLNEVLRGNRPRRRRQLGYCGRRGRGLRLRSLALPHNRRSIVDRNMQS